MQLKFTPSTIVTAVTLGLSAFLAAASAHWPTDAQGWVLTIGAGLLAALGAFANDPAVGGLRIGLRGRE